MTAVLGSAMSEAVDVDAMDAVVVGVADWVEGKRRDLLVTDDEVDPPQVTFEPTPSVVLGAAMLAWRTYKRRETPLGIVAAAEDTYAGILRNDPDIARYLGIGRAGRFVFGGHNPDTAEAVV